MRTIREVVIAGAVVMISVALVFFVTVVSVVGPSFRDLRARIVSFLSSRGRLHLLPLAAGYVYKMWGISGNGCYNGKERLMSSEYNY